MKSAVNAAGIAPIMGPKNGIILNTPAINPSKTGKSTFRISNTTVQRVPTIIETKIWPLMYFPPTPLTLSIMVEA